MDFGLGMGLFCSHSSFCDDSVDARGSVLQVSLHRVSAPFSHFESEVVGNCLVAHLARHEFKGVQRHGEGSLIHRLSYS